MAERHVGALVVVADQRPIGIITDRDLTLRVLAHAHDAHTPVGNVMSPRPFVVHEHDRVDQALYLMRRSGVRRLPIVDDHGKLVGLVSLDDLLVLLSSELSSGIDAVMENRGP